MKVELRSLLAVDAGILSSLHGDSTELPWSAESFVSLLRHRHRFGWLADADGEAAGYILVQEIAGDAEILSLAVQPARQGQGIGRKLVERALTEIAWRGARRLLLEVATTNSRAIALYSGLGFQRIGHRRAYYQRRGGLEDALVMAYVCPGGSAEVMSQPHRPTKPER